MFQGTNNSSPHSDSDIRALEAGRMMSGHPHQAGVPYYPPVPGIVISLSWHLLHETRKKCCKNSLMFSAKFVHILVFNLELPITLTDVSCTEDKRGDHFVIVTSQNGHSWLLIFIDLVHTLLLIRNCTMKHIFIWNLLLHVIKCKTTTTNNTFWKAQKWNPIDINLLKIKIYIFKMSLNVLLLTRNLQRNLCNLTPKFSDILWHPTKMYSPKVFLLTEIKLK